MAEARTHNLKTWPKQFAQVWIDMKSAEFRVNDRDFRVGDEMILNEWDPDEQDGYTGRSVVTTITHILRHADGLGVPMEYAMLSFRVESHGAE